MLPSATGVLVIIVPCYVCRAFARANKITHTSEQDSAHKQQAQLLLLRIPQLFASAPGPGRGQILVRSLPNGSWQLPLSPHSILGSTLGYDPSSPNLCTRVQPALACASPTPKSLVLFLAQLHLAVLAVFSFIAGGLTGSKLPPAALKQAPNLLHLAPLTAVFQRRADAFTQFILSPMARYHSRDACVFQYCEDD